MGINLGLDHRKKCEGWFDDIAALMEFLQELYAESGRRFEVLICYRSKPWLQNHLCFVETEPVDLVLLRDMIERLT